MLEYLTALYQNDYPPAYGLLSPDSRARLALEEFVEAARVGQIEYQVHRATVERLDERRALVTIPQVEDPAEHGFGMLEQDGRWWVILHGGGPFAPEWKP